MKELAKRFKVYRLWRYRKKARGRRYVSINLNFLFWLSLEKISDNSGVIPSNNGSSPSNWWDSQKIIFWYHYKAFVSLSTANLTQFNHLGNSGTYKVLVRFFEKINLNFNNNLCKIGTDNFQAKGLLLTLSLKLSSTSMLFVDNSCISTF